MFDRPQDEPIGQRSNDEDDEPQKDKEDDDEEGSTPYGRRSLSWTNKYRELLPYSYAKKTARNLGLRSVEEWYEYLADGKVYHGPYLPSRPDEMYVDDWESWEEFLGLTRTYDETRQLVQGVFQFTSMDQYKQFIMDDPQRAEALRIPAMPEVVYKDMGWISSEHFLGITLDENISDE